MSIKSDKFVDGIPQKELERLNGSHTKEVDDGEFGVMVFDLRGLLKEVLSKYDNENGDGHG